MRTRIITASVACGLSTTAQAQDWQASAGIAVTSEYVSQGLRFSDGVAFQPYVKLGFKGFYVGGYASNVDPNATLANTEVGLNFGLSIGIQN